VHRLDDLDGALELRHLAEWYVGSVQQELFRRRFDAGLFEDIFEVDAGPAGIADATEAEMAL
jgi:hypothetical protein